MRVPTVSAGLLSALAIAALASGQIRPDNHQIPGTLTPGPSPSGSGGVNQNGSQSGGRAPANLTSAGFTSVARSGAMGQALTASFSIGSSAAGSSAKAAFRTAFEQASASFDKTPALQSAAADRADQQVQGFFRASLKNTPIRGLLIVSTANGRASALLLLDREDQFASSLPALAKQVRDNAPRVPGSGPGGAPVRPQLVQTRLTDGSGSIGLAPGWRITGAYKGTVDAQGPNESIVSLGGYQHVFPRGNYPKKINGPYLQPWPAWQAYVDAINDHAIRNGRASIRLIEQVPTQAKPGQESAYIAYEVVTADGKRRRGLASVITSPFHDDLGSWFFYASFVGGLAERFPEDFPTMWEMWKSWSVNQAVFKERMDSVLKSMREINGLIQAANADRQHAFDNHDFGWDETFRGVTMIENTQTKGRIEVDTNYAQQLVEEANSRGYPWRIVPVNELLP